MLDSPLVTPQDQAEIDELSAEYLRELRDGRLAYKPAEAARLLGVDERTVRRLMATGQIKAVSSSTRLTLISRNALYEFLGIAVDEPFRRAAAQ